MHSIEIHLANKGELHHFNIIENYSLNELKEAIGKNLEYEISISQFDQILVDDARELIQMTNRKRVGDKLIYVIECNDINIQAQNSLLKLFEEPKDNYIFFVILPNTINILPTLISRAEVWGGNIKKEEVDLPKYEDVKNMNMGERVKLATDIMNDIKKEKITKGDVKKFVNNIMIEMEEGVKSNSKELSRINEVSRYIDLNGSSLKSILEYTLLNI